MGLVGGSDVELVGLARRSGKGGHVRAPWLGSYRTMRRTNSQPQENEEFQKLAIFGDTCLTFAKFNF